METRTVGDFYNANYKVIDRVFFGTIGLLAVGGATSLYYYTSRRFKMNENGTIIDTTFNETIINKDNNSYETVDIKQEEVILEPLNENNISNNNNDTNIYYIIGASLIIISIIFILRK
jgi:hypothetical protein